MAHTLDFLDKSLSRRQTIGLSVSGTVLAGFLTRLISEKVRRDVFSKLVPASVPLTRSDEAEGVYTIRTSGVPSHAIGLFPNLNCPCKIRPQHLVLQLTKAPSISAYPTSISASLFGVAINGVVFDPAGPYWKQRMDLDWQYEVASPLGKQFLGLDMSHAHVQHSGAYHYHGIPEALIQSLLTERARRGESAYGKMLLVGWAADGFPIYAPWGHRDPGNLRSRIVPVRSSYVVKGGPRVNGPSGIADGTFVRDHEYRAGEGDLDECNGRFGATPEFPGGTYHYFLTHQFPYVPRMWKGRPHPSFVRDPRMLTGAPVPPGLTNIFG